MRNRTEMCTVYDYATKDYATNLHSSFISKSIYTNLIKRMYLEETGLNWEQTNFG